MSRVVVNNSVTLDGVMQAPGRPDEDPRGGFEHGGWAQPYFDSVMGSVAAEGIAKGGSLLLGRRTYEDFAAFWPIQTDENPSPR
jgi:dihydrofolate reductase